MTEHTIEAHFKVEAKAQADKQAAWDAEAVAIMAEALRDACPDMYASEAESVARGTFAMLKALGALQLERVKQIKAEAVAAHRKAYEDAVRAEDADRAARQVVDAIQTMPPAQEG